MVPNVPNKFLLPRHILIVCWLHPLCWLSFVHPLADATIYISTQFSDPLKIVYGFFVSYIINVSWARLYRVWRALQTINAHLDVWTLFCGPLQSHVFYRARSRTDCQLNVPKRWIKIMHILQTLPTNVLEETNLIANDANSRWQLVNVLTVL